MYGFLKSAIETKKSIITLKIVYIVNEVFLEGRIILDSRFAANNLKLDGCIANRSDCTLTRYDEPIIRVYLAIIERRHALLYIEAVYVFEKSCIMMY